jgi:hypothetical protein
VAKRFGKGRDRTAERHLGGRLPHLHADAPIHFRAIEGHLARKQLNARPPKIETVENGETKKVPASAWLDRNKPVEQMTWAPGMPTIIRNRLIAAGGWIERDGVSVFNLYRPPAVRVDDQKAGRWLDHLHLIYPQDAEHIATWFACRVQRPAEKINHALLLAGAQGIGKDTILEPVK